MPRTFPLAAVLSLRQQKEEAEERTLAARAAQVQQVRASLTRLEHELAQCAEVRAREVQTVLTGAHLQASYGRLNLLRDAQKELLEQMRVAEALRAEQQVRYLAAKGNREMLTELKETHQSAWDAEMQSREQKRIDDLFAARRLRQ